MTKKEEKQALADFIHSLPTESYLRPWLEHIEYEIHSAIDSDFELTFHPSEYTQRMQALKTAVFESAQLEANEIIRKAERKEKLAQSYTENVLKSLHNHVRKVETIIEHY